MNNELRKKYWNKDYVEYWKERVDSTNKMADDEIQKSSNDPTAPDSRYIQLINLLNTQPKDSVLDVGCGFGRSLPYLASIAKEVIGIDISSQMIDESRKLTAHLPNVELKVSESESMKINRESIDKIICFAAFDAMYQKIALIEFNRICKLDGEVLITGKNDFFKDDDLSALDAEIGAREKGHPNFFTDVKSLMHNISIFGFEIINKEFFLRRGDFAIDKKQTVFCEKFYEYTFVLKKISNIVESVELIPGISDTCSKTYKLKNKDV